MKAFVNVAVGLLSLMVAAGVLMAQDAPKPASGAAGASAAGAPLLGSPDFRPSPERPVGWRGDGAGRYPNADPPVNWEIRAKVVKELSAQARKPKEGDTGTPTPDGAIKEWLVLPEAKDAPEGFAERLADASPDVGDKVGDAAWQAVAIDTTTLDFNSVFAKGRGDYSAAYAMTYFYSKSGGPLIITLHTRGHPDKLWVNGKLTIEMKTGAGSAARADAKNIVKGWNRLLVRSNIGKESWFSRVNFLGPKGCEYTRKNILWSFPVPAGIRSHGISSPIIVGEKFFVPMETNNLCCLDKNTGKLLWIRTATYADCLSDEEKKANPDVMNDLAPLLGKLKELNAKGTGSVDIEAKVAALVKKIDAKKYPKPSNGWGECGFCPATPASDGTCVYVVYGSGVVECHDLDGGLKWAALYPDWPRDKAHGTASSPLLIDGKLISFGDFSKGVAFDAATGKVLWQSEPKDAGWKGRYAEGTASPVALDLDGTKCFVTPLGISRAKDGQLLWDNPSKGNFQAIPSAIVQGRTVILPWMSPPALEFTDVTDFSAGAVKVNIRTLKVDQSKFPTWCFNWNTSSPLYHVGLVYWLSEDGILSVADAAKAEIVYQKQLDLHLWMHANAKTVKGGSGSSMTLAGKYLYVFGNQGTSLVLELGRTYKQVAKNQIEALHDAYGWYQESMESCPVFEGKRMYVSCEENVYCVGAQ